MPVEVLLLVVVLELVCAVALYVIGRQAQAELDAGHALTLTMP